jgi:hypothetical protein
MSQLQHKFKYYPDVEKSGWVADQVYNSAQVEYMDYAHDGAVVNMYSHSGGINKSVPLTMRPPVNKTYYGFKGTIVPRDKALGFYDVSSGIYRS